jgi:hypothetical protein
MGQKRQKLYLKSRAINNTKPVIVFKDIETLNQYVSDLLTSTDLDLVIQLLDALVQVAEKVNEDSPFAFELMSSINTYHVLIELITNGPCREELKTEKEDLAAKVLEIKFAALTVFNHLAYGEYVLKFLMVNAPNEIITLFCEQIPYNLGEAGNKLE